MKIIPELKEIVVNYEQKQKTMGNDIGTGRVDVVNIEHLRHEATSEGFTFTIDEPSERGGTNKGLHPLGHFIIGAASCLLNQCVRETISKDLRIDTLKVTARAHWDRAKSRSFTDMIFDIKITGAESKENVTELMHAVEGRCFAHQTLKKAIPVTTNVILNNVKIASNTLAPDKKNLYKDGNNELLIEKE